MNGVVLAPSFSTANQTGCVSTIQATYALWAQYETNTLTVSTTDGYHPVTVSPTFIYDPAYEHKPIVKADLATALIPALQARSDTFRVKNPGTFTITYQVSVDCTALAVTCTAPTFVTVLGGATGFVPVSYTAPASGANKALTFRATYAGTYTTTYDSASTLVSIGAGSQPLIAVTPVNGSSTSSPTATLAATWCIPSGSFVSRQMLFKGLPLADTFVSQTVAGCAVAGTSTWTGMSLDPGPNTIVAQAMDVAGHRASATNIVTYVPSLASFTPQVSPKGTTITAKRSTTSSALFTVFNPSANPATFTYGATCSTSAYSDCGLSRTVGTLPPGGRDTVRAWYTAPGTYGTTATLTFIATGTAWPGQSVADTARVTLSTPTVAMSYQPVISPTTGAWWGWPGWGFGQGITVTNLGSDTAAYTYTLTTTPGSIVLHGPSIINGSLPAMAPGATSTIWISLMGNCNNCTSPVDLTVRAMGGADSVTALGHYSMAGHSPTFGIVVTHQTVKIDSLAATVHEIPYTVTATGNSYGDTIRVRFECDPIVINCRGDLSNTLNQEHLVMPGGTPGTGKILYQLSSGGVGQVRIYAKSSKDTTQKYTGYITVSTAYNVAQFTVSPSTISVSPPAGLPLSQAFKLTNTGFGNSPDDAFTYSASCTGSITNCSTVSGTTSTLPTGTSTNIVVAFTSPPNGQAGVVNFSAQSVKDPSVVRTGQLTVTAGTASLLAVSTSTVNPGANVERAACLTVSGGPGAAYECADLRLAHAAPVTTTMGKARAPTLTYVSRHASPVALIAANVTAQLGVQPPQGILATVQVNGRTIRRTIAWPASWSDGRPRRIVVPVPADSANLSTGAYRYTLEIKPADSTSTLGAVSDTGTFTIIDRRASQYGAGWWVDGVEQLVFNTPDTTQRVWIGGDGSTRLYSKVTASTWVVTPTLDRPDTLTFSDSTFARHLRNGASVEFDRLGHHVRTISAIRDTTMFVYTQGTNLVSSITLPISTGQPASQRPAYTFAYTNGLLDSIVAPPISPTIPRVTRISRITGTASLPLIHHFTDPDGHTVTFGYDGTNQLVSRDDRLNQRTTYTYGVQGVFRSSTITMPAGQTIVRGYCSVQIASLRSCGSDTTDAANIYTWVTEGRTDVDDTTRFVLDRFSAPKMIVSALHDNSRDTTRIERDLAWPLLASAVVAPNGFRTEVRYNARGLDSASTAINPYGDGNTLPPTTYTWHGKWDLPIAVVGPSGETTQFAYDSILPNKIWQQDGRGQFSRVNFTYVNRRLTDIQYPGTPQAGAEHIEYDGLGNGFRQTSPLSFVTSTHRDAIGRVDSVYTPIDGSQVHVQATGYDIMDRVITQRDSAGSTTSDRSVLAISNFYDDEGNLTRVTQSGTPDPANIGAMTRAFQYDPLGRKISERIWNGTTVTSEQELYHWTYDPAGNVTTGGRDAVGVTLGYDGLNRLRSRSGPNAATYTYDQGGHILTANNAAARISRAYFPNGQLKTDTLRIATSDSTAPSYTQHVYALTSTYDLSGRRTQIGQALVSGGIATGTGNTAYAYNTLSGLLETVTDPLGYQYRYGYDADSRVSSITSRYGRADSLSEVHRYDPDSRLTRRLISMNGATVRDDSLFYDQRSKIRQRLSNGAPFDSATYDGRGRTTHSAFGAVDEQLTVDVFNNTTHKSGIRVSPSQVDYGYEAATGRLVRQTNPGSQGHSDSTTYGYDGVGNLMETQALSEAFYSNAQIPQGMLVTIRTLSSDTYDDRNKLTRHQFVYDTVFTSIVTPNFSSHASNLVKYTTTAMYRYDALGRRVWARTMRDTLCTKDGSPERLSGCASTVTRSVWDGDQLVYEFQTDGPLGASAGSLESDGTPGAYYGAVGYVHGNALDAPLAIYKTGQQVLPLSAWHGQFDAGICGTTFCSTDLVPFTSRHLFGPSHSVVPSWYGSLMGNQLDPSGYVYLRNRYYDPASGRFTQEDPIGLAGGMNLYGFGGGDPVNHADPFGLCIDGFTTVFCIEGAILATGALAATTANFLATHPEAAAALSHSVSDATATASDAWDGFKKAVGRGVAGAALVGGMLAGGSAADLARRFIDIQKARAAQVEQKKKLEDERKRKDKETKGGGGSGGGGDGGGSGGGGSGGGTGGPDSDSDSEWFSLCEHT